MEEERYFWPTVIISEGEPYVLTKLKRAGVNDPCSMCDLREKCMTEIEFLGFYELCTNLGRSDSWYFEKNWDIYNVRVADLLNIDLAPDLEALTNRKHIMRKKRITENEKMLYKKAVRLCEGGAVEVNDIMVKTKTTPDDVTPCDVCLMREKCKLDIVVLCSDCEIIDGKRHLLYEVDSVIDNGGMV